MSPVAARTRTSRRCGTAIAAGALTVAVAALAGLCGAIAVAHEGNDPAARWYRSLQMPTGGSCCDATHCQPTEARTTGDHWEVLVEHEDEHGGSGFRAWLSVPPEAVLRRENEIGYPVVCIIGGRIVCFVPGQGT